MPQAMLKPGLATGFEPTDTGLRAVLPNPAERAVLRSARVELPRLANGAVHLEDDTTHVAVDFHLEGTEDRPVEVADGIARYPRALGGADVLHRVHAEGTEDYVVFEDRPAREELRYTVDVSRVAGLRLVSNTLEFLDAGGAPRLRIAPPYLVDSTGAKPEATVSVRGCAFDTYPEAPWGRPIVGTGANRCEVRVAWAAASYPLMVDPSWSATGSMAVARERHFAVRLGSGMVLVAGGTGGLGSELYDPASGTFASTGSMASPHDLTAATRLQSGRVLVAGGMVGAASEEYDPSNGTWSPVGSMLSPRNNHTATLMASGKVLAAGGQSAAALSAAEIYDPTTKAWTPAAPMSVARSRHLSTLLPSGAILVVGGAGLATAEAYSPASNGWSAAGTMSSERTGGALALLADGRVLVAGGGTSGSALPSAELFDPATTKWTLSGPTVQARVYHAVAAFPNGTVLAAGGFPGTATAELFDASTMLWASMASMGALRSFHTATVLDAAHVLIVGGNGSPATLASAEVLSLDPIGATCLRRVDCATAYCVNGHCCDRDCNSACEVCAQSLGATADGTCTKAPPGYVGTPFCAPYVCDGAAKCPTACTLDQNCVASSHCRTADGTCVEDFAIGAACDASSECKSQFCVDGLCCDSACDGTCQSCSAAGKVSGQGDGVCGLARAGTDPHGDCPDDGAPSCQRDGTCDGAGTCRRYVQGTPCEPSGCATDTPTGSACDGTGACVPVAFATCAPFACLPTGCASACTSAAECSAGAWCHAGACEPMVGKGSPCSQAEECASGHCVDGLCCNQGCLGQCEACDVAGAEGTCVPVAGAPRNGRAACAKGSPSSPCSRTSCDGIVRDSCVGFVGPSVTCRDPSCAGGIAVFRAACDGKGHCPDPRTKACNPFVCGAAACKDSCSDDSDCASAYRCSEGKCAAAATCDGDHTVTSTAGTRLRQA